MYLTRDFVEEAAALFVEYAVAVRYHIALLAWQLVGALLREVDRVVLAALHVDMIITFPQVAFAHDERPADGDSEHIKSDLLS